MKIILGPASQKLGEEVADLLSLDVISLVFKIRPDGESYIRLGGSVRNEDVAIVQTTSPPQDARLIQLALIADAARRHGAEKITAVVPYLAYARQDKIFLKGEALSILAIAQMLMAAGINRLITVNVHSEKVLSKFPFPAKTVSSIHLLAEYFKRRGFENAFALAPDDGALWLVEEARQVLGGGCGYLEKHRDHSTGQITTKKKDFDVKGKTVIIFDDIISTGGTVVAAAEILKSLEVDKIFAACAHPLLIGDSKERILKSGVEEIVGTDSVPSSVSKVSLAPLLSKELAG
jgi:ribose-phosphate pyrophosphokinase